MPKKHVFIIIIKIIIANKIRAFKVFLLKMIILFIKTRTKTRSERNKTLI